jgi:dihydroorotate dehydrogenase
MLARLHLRLDGRIPLIGAGGIDNAARAFAKIEAGASLLQLYSALVFKGPALIGEIVSGLAERLKVSGAAHIGELVGSKASAYQNGAGI